MKRTFFPILLIPVLCVMTISLTGCDGNTAQSMTEDVEISEIEAYEQAQKAMEAEDAAEMDMDIE